MIEFYYYAYTAVVLTYLWYQYFFIVAVKENKYPDYPTTFSVVVPAYNEDPEAVERTVVSILAAKGEKEIIVIDDGSKEIYKKKLRKTLKGLPVRFIDMPENKGKRVAQSEGFKFCNNELIITIDSDTTINKDSLLEIAKPFSNPKIGAVTGVLELYNKNENLFTKMLNGRYLNSFHFERKMQATYGGVNCCCGGFSAYRTSVIKPRIKEYLEQKFLGKECTFGDDRHLTNIVLKTHEVGYNPKAIGHTVSPSTVKSFVKQQIRWKQSFIRENFITLQNTYKIKPMVFWDTFVIGAMPIFSLLIRVLMLWTIIIYPLSIFYYIALISMISFVRNYLLIHDNKKEFFYAALYGFFHIGVVYWIYYISLYKLFVEQTTGWVTR